jgi:hypothetical protein
MQSVNQFFHTLTLSVSVESQPHIQAHLVLPDTQSRPFAKPKELEFSQRTDDRNKSYF